MKRILITGITGFIGSHLAQGLEEIGLEVFGTTNSPDKSNDRNHYIDFYDEEALHQWLLKYKPDAVVHTAAITNVMHKDLSEIYRTNVIYTENLLNALTTSCSVDTKVIVMSTAGVYGNNQSKFIDESMVTAPNNHYSYSKLVVEHLCNHYLDKLNISIVRPFNIIGRGQRENFLIPKLASCFANRAENVPLGNIDAVRDYLSIDDCVRVLIKIITQNVKFQGPVNICSGTGYSARDAIEILQKISGYKLSYFINPDFVRKNEIWRLVGSPEKLEIIMNDDVVVTSSFEDVLREIYEDYVSRAH